MKEGMLEVEFICTPVINFAMQQNHVPIVRKFIIKNNAGVDLQNVDVSVAAEPGFALAWSKKIDSIAPGESLDMGVVDLRISTKYLSELTERITGFFTVIIQSGEAILFKETYSVDLLTYDQWGGSAILPEMLAAFITPNHPEIPNIIRRAAVLLEKWTGSPSFDEYQTRNPDRVKKQMAAIYEAMAEKQVVYCSVPASFEESGQRIRLADAIFSQQMGNCLDLSLLYAGCLEAVGIHPLIVIIKGHAFAGAWLANDVFADAVNDDPSLITKRIADGINEIAIVEATCMNAGQKAQLDYATRAAKHHLVKEDDFIFFVDVKRARYSGIRPLPLRVQTQTGWEIIEENAAPRNNDAPEEITPGLKITDVGRIEFSRQKLWERKLLDLSLRNNLLNLRVSKGTVQIISVNIGQIEDCLADGQEFQVLPKPGDWDNPLRNAGVYQSINLSDPVVDLVKQELSQKRLRSYLSESELAGALTNLYRSSRLSLEENGANTLYFSLGLLKWYETGSSERPRYAPLLLMPVEIVRRSAQKGYIIRGREEETMINITLLEMLKQDFGITIGGLEPLPKDESGVDVKLIFNIVRQAIMSQSRWDVEEQAFLGNFSFSKFIMWHDIHSNADKLSRNKIAASLISGKLEWQTEDTADDHKNLDRHYRPSEVALPISADSSQLEAIFAAAGDKSFILHGPPGTGKSQTITNIIANALYQGKKVLFVAEKMAALSVVQSRLAAIGLGPFCLELHSNKAKKSVVLEQLKKTTEIVKNTAPQDFASESHRLHLLRSELNDYVDALHKIHPFDYSLYDVFTAYPQYGSASGDIRFEDRVIAALTKSKLTEWDDIVEELQIAGAICGHPYNHPLEYIHIPQYSQQVKEDVRGLLSRYIDTLTEFKSSLTAACNALQIGMQLTEQEQFNSLKALCGLFCSLPDVPATMIAAGNIEQTLKAVVKVAENGVRRDELRGQLLTAYTNGILTFDAERTLSEWNIADQQWFLPKLLKQRAIKKSLQALSTTGKISPVKIIGTLQVVISYQKEQAVIDSNTAMLSPLLDFLWQNGNAAWADIAAICEKIIIINKEALRLINNTAKTKEWRNRIAAELPEGTAAYLAINNSIFNEFIAVSERLSKEENRLVEMLHIDFSKLRILHTNGIENRQAYARQWLGSLELLKNWFNWTETRKKAIAAGLSPVVAAYEDGLIENTGVLPAYKKGLLISIASYIIAREPGLSSFNGQLFEEKIKKFRKISSYFQQLTKEELFAKLAARIPSFTQEAATSSEIGILQRAIRSGARGMSIRKLFDSIPNLLPRMCSCMLMSPISVAQYFEAGATKFDLVIFDEASQMPTCEAVGAIARATNVVVVGDPKQMPPTSFFSAQYADEDNLEQEDLESILDDCLALSMPQHHLSWHYRSRHESLIAFSNARFYDNKLMTFPSPDDIASKVTHVPVGGYYDRSKTRQNAFEAKAIVEEMIHRLSDPVLSKQSIGVVTFSSVQQALVEDMFNDALKNRPDLEALLLKSAEPIFIKNLENVQGDERDVILFSVGYGPDKEGKVNLNFGPLNREGGERRLNVAVSRARYEMKVFSTLRADQVDITRSSSEGVAALKAFLEYAEKGKSILAYRHGAKAARAGGFIESVAGEIRKHGYMVHTNIGSSGYKIDIGVVHPAKPAEYILGILCDGYNYNAARTAGDREIVQFDVLRSLGWNIHKIWSTEWWEQPDIMMQGIVDAIKSAENKDDNNAPDVEDGSNELMPKEEQADALLLNRAMVSERPPEKAPIAPLPSNEYQVCHLESVHSASADDFLQAYNRQKVCDQVTKIIDLEAPISRALLCKRALSAWGITRAGARINAHFDLLFSALKLNYTGENRNVFFWKPGQDPRQYTGFRLHTEKTKRDAEDIPPEEVANAVKDILQNQISLQKDELVRETARLFSYARIGSTVEIAMLKGIAMAVSNNAAVEDNGRVVLKE